MRGLSQKVRVAQVREKFNGVKKLIVEIFFFFFLLNGLVYNYYLYLCVQQDNKHYLIECDTRIMNVSKLLVIFFSFSLSNIFRFDVIM